MKKQILFSLVFCMVLITPGLADMSGIKAGDSYVHENTNYIVAGAGTSAFEYTATGESLVVVMGETPASVMVIVPNAGEVVKVDPSVPMVWVAGKQNQSFAGNSWLMKNGKGKPYMLLEYDRASN